MFLFILDKTKQIKLLNYEYNSSCMFLLGTHFFTHNTQSNVWVETYRKLTGEAQKFLENSDKPDVAGQKHTNAT